MSFKLHLIVGGLIAMAPAFAAEWMTDLDAARGKAAAKGKTVLVDFTGSDWCHWCVVLREKVLDTPEFEAYAQPRFVLAEIDVPNNPADPALRERNNEICKQYHVTSFPTLMVLDARGTVLGGVQGYRPDKESIKESLEEARRLGDELNAARRLQGDEKVAALMAVYNKLPKLFVAKAISLRKEIAQADPGDKSGLAGQVRAEDQMEAFLTEFKAAKDPDASYAILERYLAKAEPANRPRMLRHKYSYLNNKGIGMLNAAQTVEDVEKARDCLLAAVSCLPEQGRAKEEESIRKAFANPRAMLDEINKYRESRKK